MPGIIPGELVFVHFVTEDNEFNSSKESKVDASDMDKDVQPFIKRNLFLPEGRCSHQILQVNGNAITAISVRQMKVDTVKIIDDHKKRMLPRFR